MNDLTPAGHDRRRLLCRCGAALAAFGTLALAGCSRESGDTAAAAAADFDNAASCALDGMLLAEYPGPKGQLLVGGQAQPEWYCDTLELLNVLLRPEQVRKLRGAWVQDMARADWERPRGHWVDARSAHYVLGSRRKGSMGATAASFAEAAAAQAFAAQQGGRVLAFADLKPEMVDLSGGALHDTRM
jgi:copper chaperone NosL